MSTTTKDQGGKRRNKVYGGHDLPGARSSGNSLVSNITGTPGVSMGSSSTLTQDACPKTSKPSERRKKSKTRSERNHEMGEDTIETTTNLSNVFKFLVEGAKEAEVPQPEPEMVMIRPQRILEPQPETVQPELEKPEKPTESRESILETYYRNQLSDSGISMGSSISEPHLDSMVKHPLPPVVEETKDYSTYAPSVVDPYYPHEPQMWGHYGGPVYTPEPIPLSPASIRGYVYPHEQVYHGTPDPPSTGDSGISCLDTAPLIFREKGNKRSPHPQMFRSFANINARMLLQMQSNIADLEHELAILDVKSEASAKSRKSEHHIAKHAAKDQAHRTDLYQELYTNLEQYYDALASFNRISSVASPCSPEDAKAFRAWLQTQVLPSSRTGALVGDGSDLIRLKRRSSYGSDESSDEDPIEVVNKISTGVKMKTSRTAPNHSSHQHLYPNLSQAMYPFSNQMYDQGLLVTAYGVFINVFFPMLLFKISSSVLTRLILLSLTTTAAALIMERHRTMVKVELGNLHWHCIIGCASISMFAALFL